MRTKLAALVIGGPVMAVVFTACDAFAAYTVINNTNQELITWPFFEECSVVAGKKQDYLDGEVIRPGERLDYFHAYYPYSRDPRCVQVTTLDRRLVLAERYEYGGTYYVKEPLRPYGDPIPERDDLPDQSFGESLRETPLIWLVLQGLSLAFGLGVLAAFLFAGFITVRFFYRYYRSKP